MKSHKLQFLFTGILFILLFAGAASAETKQPKKQKRFYFGLNLPYNTIGGDFSGDKYLSVPSTGEVLMCPELESGMGFGGAIGYTKIGLNNMGYSLEIGFQQSSHDYSWLSYSGNASLGALNFNAKGIYSSGPVEPYLLLGLVIPWLKIEDGAGLENTGTYTNKADAKYSGVGINIGGGADLFLTPNISFGGRAIYRWINYGYVNGNSGKIKVEDGVGGSGLHICGALTYNIPMK